MQANVHVLIDNYERMLPMTSKTMKWFNQPLFVVSTSKMQSDKLHLEDNAILLSKFPTSVRILSRRSDLI